MSAPSVSETREAIDSALRDAAGPYAQYSCKTVSWDDVARGEVNGSLSCWGANITDTYLKGKDGSSLFTVRPQNWNEKLGVVRASDVALLIGNCDMDGSSTAAGQSGLRNVTLEQFLQKPTQFGARYSGLNPNTCLADAAADMKVSIRFQTVFLPVAESGGKRETFQFATEAYNYNTRSDKNPRNLILLATTQGLSVQADGSGTKRLLQHAKDGDSVSEYWLEAERSDHKVGGAQVESAAERRDALVRGKATSEVIGIKAMGTRFNVLMTLQVPLAQKVERVSWRLAKPTPSGSSGSAYGGQLAGMTAGHLEAAAAAAATALQRCQEATAGYRRTQGATAGYRRTAGSSLASLKCGSSGGGGGFEVPACHTAPGSVPPAMGMIHPAMGMMPPPMPPAAGMMPLAMGMAPPPMGTRTRAQSLLRRGGKKGTANAARVSRGNRYGLHQGLAVTDPKRNESEHVTITCVFYNTVAGGVPSETDVRAAIEDMEGLYDACSANGRLADAAFDFMKSELTVGQAQKIQDKIYSQPPVVTNPPPPETPPLVSDDNTSSMLIKSKFLAFIASPSRTAAQELKLMTLGAISEGDADTKGLVSSKFDGLLEDMSSSVSGSVLKPKILELELIVKGAVG